MSKHTDRNLTAPQMVGASHQRCWFLFYGLRAFGLEVAAFGIQGLGFKEGFRVQGCRDFRVMLMERLSSAGRPR